MEQSILTWNVPNVVSVWLMALLGILLFFFISKAIRANGQA